MSTTTRSSGIGLCGATFLLLLALRLTDHIDWAWYWVAAPLWMPAGFVLGVLALVAAGFCVVYAVAVVIDAFASARRRRRRAMARARKP